MQTIPEYEVNTKVRIMQTMYAKELGIENLTGVITKKIHKHSGLTYNIECEENGDSLCCVPASQVMRIG